MTKFCLLVEPLSVDHKELFSDSDDYPSRVILGIADDYVTDEQKEILATVLLTNVNNGVIDIYGTTSASFECIYESVPGHPNVYRGLSYYTCLNFDYDGLSSMQDIRGALFQGDQRIDIDFQPSVLLRRYPSAHAAREEAKLINENFGHTKVKVTGIFV